MAPRPPDRAAVGVRQARIAVGALFLINGALFATILPRFPEIKSDLAMSNVVFGGAVASFSAGALVAGPAAAVLVRRLGSARLALASTLMLAAMVTVAGSATTPLMLAAALFGAGAADAVADVAQNVNALRLQRIYGRSIINSLHAVWALGALAGGLAGAAAIALGVPRTAHLGTAAVMLCLVMAMTYRNVLRDRDHEECPSALDGEGVVHRGAVYLTLLALVAVAMAGAVVEDAGSSWATLYLSDSLRAPAAVATFGYISLVGFLCIGRFLGDRLVDRFGERALVRVGGLLAAVGMGVALAFPSIPVTVAGFGAAGFGVATVIPAAMRAADELPGLRPGTGLTVLTWSMRAGFFFTPLAIGALADVMSLRVGLVAVPVAGVVLVLLAGQLGAVGATPRRS